MIRLLLLFISQWWASRRLSWVTVTPCRDRSPVLYFWRCWDCGMTFYRQADYGPYPIVLWCYGCHRNAIVED